MGTTAPSLLRPLQSLFVGILRYSLPVFNGTSKINIGGLLNIEARAFQACLGLPRAASTTVSIAVSHQMPVSDLQVQETLHLHFRHFVGQQYHHLASVDTDQGAFDFAKYLP